MMILTAFIELKVGHIKSSTLVPSFEGRHEMGGWMDCAVAPSILTNGRWWLW